MKIEDLKKIVDQIPENSEVTIAFDDSEAILEDIFAIVKSPKKDNEILSSFKYIFYKEELVVSNLATDFIGNTLIVFDKNDSRKDNAKE